MCSVQRQVSYRSTEKFAEVGAAAVNDPYAEGEENTDAPRRIAHDGRAYTRAQFERYYGGAHEWDAATPSQAPAI